MIEYNAYRPKAKKVIKTNMSQFMCGRTCREVAEATTILSPQAIHNYLVGKRKPDQASMPYVLAALGKPWGRILDESEVWPNA